MLIKDAITYLENQSIKASDRFKVLTGFDTKADAKDRDSSYWFNDLHESGIIEELETTEATASVGSFFSSAFNSISGNDLKSKLKAAYKKGSDADDSDEQTEGQEEYIAIIVTYLKKYQANELLVNFQFTEAEKLLKRAVEPARTNSPA
jgi:hypothetical protein